MMKRMIVACLLSLACTLFGEAAYTAKNFDHLLGHVDGIDDEVLKMHFRLYQGYVNNTNQLLKLLQDLDAKGNMQGQEFGALKKVFGFEFDGMRLHEYYFENLGKTDRAAETSPLMKQIIKDFGSYDNWKRDFIATGLIRGIGWVILYYDARGGRLINQWITEHQVDLLASNEPLLVMDVWEHAFITQYGLDRSSYIDAFMKNINWDVVSKRFEK